MRRLLLLIQLVVLGAACSATGGGTGGSGGGGGTAGRGGSGGETIFNPSGCDVHVRGRWQVDGQDPNAETCGNIALIELAIVDESEERFWIPPELSLRCDATNDSNAVVIDGGAYIDTRLTPRNRCGGSGEILTQPRAGEYKYRWRALNDLRFVVDCSSIEAGPVEPTDGGVSLLLDTGTVNLQTGDAGTACPSP